MSITPETLLAVGSLVRVGNRRGVVVSASMERAIPSGMVAVHTVTLNERRKRTFGQSYTWEPSKPVTQTVNYSFIQAL